MASPQCHSVHPHATHTASNSKLPNEQMLYLCTYA